MTTYHETQITRSALIEAGLSPKTGIHNGEQALWISNGDARMCIAEELENGENIGFVYGYWESDEAAGWWMTDSGGALTTDEMVRDARKFSA